MDDITYTFFYSLEKVMSFYEGYLEAKKPTDEEIKKEAESWGTLFDIDLYIDTEKEWWEEVEALAKECKEFFAMQVKTVWDLVNKGQILMELKDKIECFEFWN